jgi:opacity protein-like surface antigen
MNWRAADDRLSTFCAENKLKHFEQSLFIVVAPNFPVSLYVMSGFGVLLPETIGVYYHEVYDRTARVWQIDSAGTFYTSDVSFAFSLGSGLSVNLTDRFVMDLGYRFTRFDVKTQTLVEVGNLNLKGFEIQQHQFTSGFRYHW